MRCLQIRLLAVRNVLIYFLPEIQKKVLVRFHFSLLPDGILFLGPSEHLGALTDEFSTLNRTWRIYTKISNKRLIDSEMLKSYRGVQFPASSLKNRPLAYREGWEKPLLDQFLPDGLLVNQHLQLIQTFGNASNYLQFPSGKVDLVITRLVHEDLVTPIRAALHRARQERDTVSFAAIHINMSDGQMMLDLKVSPLREDDKSTLQTASYFFIGIREIQSENLPTEDNETTEMVLTDVDIQHVAELERELAFTRESLQTTIEELETTNEELQAANEELLAANEELQSTNEELHSVNEELYSVNAEYQQKNNELTQLHDDIQNLQRSSQVLTIFLDSQLRIRNFTPAIAEMFGVLPHDVGRPFTHLLSIVKLNETIFYELTKNALEGDSSELTIVTLEEKKLIMQVLPYRTDIEDIEGVVLQFTDVEVLEGMAEQLR